LTIGRVQDFAEAVLERQLEISRTNRLLPTGTVTFLFTDIEGSTRLWETQHEAMQRALVQHDAILRNAIEGHGGYLVKSTGDGAIGAFGIAPDAVKACLAAQRALNAHTWDELSIKSRMALHSGTAEQRDGDYYGPALNRTARLMAVGHGGQTLLSLATAELVRDSLQAGVTLRDMGERRLKDLIRSERVFQVIASDLPADFPPLKTLDTRPNNLPAQTTPFIGREDAIRAIKKSLTRGKDRLLTLSGAGGTGKTRLALQAAAELVDDFEDGVFFVPLAALSDPSLVLPAIAQSFDVREVAGRRLIDDLKHYLRGREMLLVLDNFEQVIDAAAAISDLLSAAPRLKVLVTSREVLRLSGETDYPVRPLALPDSKRLPPVNVLTQYEAVALFIERATAVKPDFTVTNENAPAVAEICHRLDGLPLAIELAAARVRVLPPQRMLAELSHRLSFLMGGARDLPARQKTLRSAIDWSHHLLAAAEQKLFRRLAVFVGGCTLEAIESVCNSDNDLPVLETVESLVAKTLVNETETHGQPRFAMLETIREYAGERLVAGGEDQRVRDRHLSYFAAFAEEAHGKLMGAEQAAWLLRLETEHENMRAGIERDLMTPGSTGGLRICAALSTFWHKRGYLAEGRRWCAQVLGKPGTGEPTVERGKALAGAGTMAWRQGDYYTARARYEESLAIARKLGDRRGIASVLGNLGLVSFDQGNFGAARTLMRDSLATMRELGDRFGVAAMLGNLGHLEIKEEDYSAAWTLLQEEASIRRELADRRGIAGSLTNLGIVAYQRGDYSAARAQHEESRAICDELGDRDGVAMSLVNLGAVAAAVGDFASAKTFSEEALSICAELGESADVAGALEGIAEATAGLGDRLRASTIWGAEERLREEIGAPLFPDDQRQHDRNVVAARAALGDDAAFEHAWQRGRALTLEQAIAFALDTDIGQR
jgi:predicted ATPase/class 3 adenylate cyclase